MVSSSQAELLRRAIANHREILALLNLWEDETAAAILNPGNKENRKPLQSLRIDYKKS